MRYKLILPLMLACIPLCAQIDDGWGTTVQLISQTSGGKLDSLYFGKYTGATYCIDLTFGETEALPMPPEGIFDIRWIESRSNNSNTCLEGGLYPFNFHGDLPRDTFLINISYDEESVTGPLRLSWAVYNRWWWSFLFMQDYSDAIEPGPDVSMLSESTATFHQELRPVTRIRIIGARWDVPSAVNDRGSSEVSGLFRNYPNPFNPYTRIEYQVASTEHVSLKIFDVLGNEIAELINGRKPAGFYSVRWDASRYPSGVYFCRLVAGTSVQTRKLILLR